MRALSTFSALLLAVPAAAVPGGESLRFEAGAASVAPAVKEEVNFAAERLRDFALSGALVISGEAAQQTWVAALDEIRSATQ